MNWLRRAARQVLQKLPKLPYSDAFYWDKVYAETWRQRGAIEWGGPPEQFLRYKFTAAGVLLPPARCIATRRPHRLTIPLFPVGPDGAVCDGALEDHVAKDADLLVVGCGNSRLSEELAVGGWDARKIVSVDFSAQGIQQAAERSQGSGDERLAALQYHVADCRSLHELFPSSSFDCAVDKGEYLSKQINCPLVR